MVLGPTPPTQESNPPVAPASDGVVETINGLAPVIAHIGFAAVIIALIFDNRIGVTEGIALLGVLLGIALPSPFVEG